MTDVVIVYDASCPNVALARERVQTALERAGLATRWRELDREHPDTPLAWRDLASPTVLVGGKDVASGVPGHAACRLYEVDGVLSGAPSVETIVAALHGERGDDSLAEIVTNRDGSTE
jgi:hypothetical protein